MPRNTSRNMMPSLDTFIRCVNPLRSIDGRDFITILNSCLTSIDEELDDIAITSTESR